MKKSTFVAMILGTIGGILFALGMCMALIPEWNAFRPGDRKVWSSSLKNSVFIRDCKKFCVN